MNNQINAVDGQDVEKVFKLDITFKSEAGVLVAKGWRCGWCTSLDGAIRERAHVMDRLTTYSNLLLEQQCRTNNTDYDVPPTIVSVPKHILTRCICTIDIVPLRNVN